MAFLILLLNLFAVTSSAHASEESLKQPVNLEIGLGIGFSHGEHGLSDSERALFAATFGYHFPRWFLGVTTRGAFSTGSNTEIDISGVTEHGRLSHRTIEYGLVARRYIDDHWYAQISGGYDYLEALAGEESLTPKTTMYTDRFYLDGTWFQFGIGHEIPDSPWFMRLEYTYTFYYHSNIIGTDQGVNRTIEDKNLLSTPHEQVLTFVVGLANIF